MSKLLRKLLFPLWDFHLSVVPENEESGEAVGTGNDDRLALLASIAEGNDTAHAEDFRDINDDDSLSAFEATPKVEEPAAEVVEEPATEPAQLYTIKVNGKEVELTYEQLIERAQKVEAADQYLAEASKLYQQAQPKPPTPDAPVEEDDAALARAIQMGTEEEAVAAIRKLRVTGPSPDALARTIDERLSFTTANQRFNSEFKDIVGDPVLYSLAQSRDAELLRSGDTRPHFERYESIGKELRAWVATKGAPVQTPPSDKETRKAAAPQAPKPASGKSAQLPAEEPEESVADTIAAIAKARGGAQWQRA